MHGKRDLKSLSHNELEAHIVGLGYPRYRADQIEHLLYKQGASIISDLDNIPKDLRNALDEDFFIGTLKIIDKQTAADGTRKYLFELNDGLLVESVGIPSSDGSKLTVCFSSQVGCPMKCSFCATGRSGFTRNLTSGEMYDQVRLVGEDFDQRVTNAVCMGQGEPFLNYDAVLDALRRMNSEKGLGIGARHITVSTCGLVDGIDRFAKEPEQFTLAISLHSPIQDTRDEIMPGVANVSLKKLRAAIKEYGESSGRRPSLEYAPIEGVNDDDEHIEALIDFCRGMLCHVNLIPLNPIERLSTDSSISQPSARMARFSAALEDNKIEHSIRKSRGKEIGGACGQLRQRHDR